MSIWHLAGAAGAEPRNQEQTDKPSSRARGARPHPTEDASMSPRSRSIAAARATSRQRGVWIFVGYLAGAVGAEPRNQERTDKPPSCVRGARPHPTGGASMPPRSRSTAAVRATSRPISQATHHNTTRVRACLRTCVRRYAAAGGPPRATELATSEQVRLARAGPSRELARRAQREGGEEHQHHHTTRVRTCVRSTQPQEARLERPSSPSRSRPASSEQAHRASSVGSHLEGRREERRQLQAMVKRTNS